MIGRLDSSPVARILIRNSGGDSVVGLRPAAGIKTIEESLAPCVDRGTNLSGIDSSLIVCTRTPRVRSEFARITKGHYDEALLRLVPLIHFVGGDDPSMV